MYVKEERVVCVSYAGWYVYVMQGGMCIASYGVTRQTCAFEQISKNSDTLDKCAPEMYGEGMYGEGMYGEGCIVRKDAIYVKCAMFVRGTLHVHGCSVCGGCCVCQLCNACNK